MKKKAKQSRKRAPIKAKGTSFERRFPIFASGRKFSLAEYEALRADIIRSRKKPIKPSGRKPSPDAFETFPEYIGAVMDWRRPRSIKSALRRDLAKPLKDQEKLTRSYNRREKAFARRTPDFYDVIGGADHISLSPALALRIRESDSGPEIAYFLAKNHRELRRINRMTPLGVARAIGAIAGRLSRQRD